MYLSKLKPKKGSLKRPKVIGRGNGAGHGRTACRGENGYNSRSGSKRRAWFEGGQMPLQRRLPKRGFHNKFKCEYAVINLDEIDKKIGETALADSAFFVKAGLVKSDKTPVKVLGTGELKKAVTVKAAAFSKLAREKIEKSGGKAEKC